MKKEDKKYPLPEPFFDWLILDCLPNDTVPKKSGIVLPDSLQQKNKEELMRPVGIVVKKGPDVTLVEEGDKVRFSIHAAVEFMYNGRSYWWVSQKGLYGKLPKDHPINPEIPNLKEPEGMIEKPSLN